MRPLRCIAALFLAVGACTPEPSEVFVPADGFEHEVDVTVAGGTEAAVSVGEALVLHARRTTGPWKKVSRTELGPDGCWVARVPEAVEPEVADNVRWEVEPDGHARFNLGLRADRTRTVQFTKPGRYTLRAVSKTWCRPPQASGRITVRVVEPTAQESEAGTASSE